MKKDYRVKMPKWIGVLIFVFGLAILGASAKIQVQAQIDMNIGEQEMEMAATESAEMKTEDESVDYYLPYPGILPDHPFYWLKMVRDRIQLWLTTNTLDRAEKLLLYADKRLGGGWALVDGNKIDLGVTTLTKAEKYLERAVLETKNFGGSGNEERFKEKLEKAQLKHKQVLGNLKAKLEGENLTVVESMLMGKEESITAEETVKLIVDFGEGERQESESQAKTAYEALEKLAEEKEWQLKTKEYDFGVLVEAIGEKQNSPEKAWIYFVNGQSGEVAADKKELNPGDLVEWKYIEPIF